MPTRNCVITGATSGIGRMAAIALANSNANLILASRNEVTGTALVKELRRQFPGSAFEFVRTDLARPADVRALATTIIQKYGQVDVLINNAGVRLDRYHQTSDGIELTFATNHLGHFALTELLIERLSQAPGARVITVSSDAHLGANADGDWYFDRRNYDRRLAYAKSKLANIMFAYELARRMKNTRITSNAVHPGLVATNFARNNGFVSWLRHIGYSALKRELILPRKGAETLVYLALSEEVAGVTAKYFYRNREVKSSPSSHDVEAARSLWDLSAKLTALRS